MWKFELEFVIVVVVRVGSHSHPVELALVIVVVVRVRSHSHPALDWEEQLLKDDAENYKKISEIDHPRVLVGEVVIVKFQRVLEMVSDHDHVILTMVGVAWACEWSVERIVCLMRQKYNHTKPGDKIKMDTILKLVSAVELENIMIKRNAAQRRGWLRGLCNWKVQRSNSSTFDDAVMDEICALNAWIPNWKLM